MKPSQFKALIEYIDAAIDNAISDHQRNEHDDGGIYLGSTPWQQKYEAEDRLRQELESE